ncbi:hypothetical protein [Pseudoxanthomonas mexicana]|uniref:hypothetical protein n=1 Tax=Pseudoxanthomonas mexicana TaxID=128785 RepID=UPI0022F37EBC|nr:hypothetical protein [Pseudoxanthomonas mexicana]WBX92835.1 hypothetical protein PE064_14155 [Pseudoxanthomonas mexicana]
MTAKIVFTFKDEAKDELRARSEKMVRTGPPFKLAGTGRSVQFLRGVFSRASLCIPAFYHFLGSSCAKNDAKDSNDFAFRVAQTYSEFSDLNTLTLSCRKLFDNASKPDLTGGNFARTSDSTLVEHAEYWAKISGRNPEECLAALRFLRRFFSECSKSETELLRSEGQLQQRIGLLIQHANRSAAHLSLEDYSLDIIDLVHFTAACTVVGEIVRSFDRPSLQPTYFNEVDTASYRAAQRVFPQIAKFQMFATWNIERQARLYWQLGEDHGIHMLLNQIHHAVGGEPKGEA